MTEPDQAQAQSKLDLALNEIALAVSDGVDVEDIALLIRKGMEVAEQLGDVPGSEKAAFAQDFVGNLIDRFFKEATPALERAIEAIDIPFLPEAVERATVDPLLKAWAPGLMREAIKASLPSLFELVVSASRGRVEVNKFKPEVHLGDREASDA